VRQTIVLEGNAPRAIEAHQYETLLAQASPERPVLDIDENSMAELFYTSGSTGRPKGVMLTHRGLYLHAMNILAELFHYGDDDVALHVVPLFHVNGWGTPHYLTAVGGRHVMMRKFQPQEVLRLIEHEGVTRLAGVPAMMNALLACPDVRQRDLSSLKGITMGGAPTPLSLLREVEAVFGCRVLCGYGLTETSPVVTSAQPKSHVSETEEHRVQRQASGGRPLPGVELRVVTPHGHVVLPDNSSVGEVAIRSNVVMAGYFRDPEGTAAAIRDGWFYTGDLATVNAEGYITIVDRLKDIIISGGENISSVEVENVLSAHPSVFECAVIAIPDDHWGEVPLALVSLRPGQTAVPEELEAHCRERLASFKVPKRWEFREELPKGGTGKILKRQLREPYWPNEPRRVN
jgi:fatty-acyl-CoA synthase